MQTTYARKQQLLEDAALQQQRLERVIAEREDSAEAIKEAAAVFGMAMLNLMQFVEKAEAAG